MRRRCAQAAASVAEARRRRRDRRPARARWSPPWRAGSARALCTIACSASRPSCPTSPARPAPRPRRSRTTRERLAEVGARRRLLTELRRKYGDTLAEVIAFRDQARTRIAELEAHDRTRPACSRRTSAPPRPSWRRRGPVGAARRAAAAGLAAAIESALRAWPCPEARFRGRGRSRRAGDDVSLAARRQPG